MYTYNRYIAQIKNDHTLRLKMGQLGLQSIAQCTINSVVNDILAWYEKGIQRHKERSFKNNTIIYIRTMFILIFSVPIALTVCSIYHMIVSILFYIYYNYILCYVCILVYYVCIRISHNIVYL